MTNITGNTNNIIEQYQKKVHQQVHSDEHCPYRILNKDLEKRIEIQDKVIAELRERVTVLQEKIKRVTNN